ncbi:NADPH:quinone reductase [Ancylobacter oerskovii]|uniref:NADPH:quinone reductase n=1 Tax=Ancylobacter oerskovii TaxID=459519 RepID=A0ABW4Z525_9HYPH|nr:NADPH:quinone reductase [Ancylobacter oerskovii]MBS7542478.1 NADPH:quinone reductase [Ancylobacter oerskovii]
MRAVFYERQGAAEDVLVLGDLPKPLPAAGEVLVRVHVSGINPSDIKNRTGFVSKMAFTRVIPHQDGAGVIEAVGEGVAPDRIGERVWIFEAQTGRAGGTAAEYVAVPSDNAVRLPDATSYEVGASLGVPALTAHRCLFADGDLRGRRVLVQGGAGVVGSAAIQLAKCAGAWVAATVRRPEQKEVAQQAGADLVLDLNAADVAAKIKAETNNAGVDRIVEVDLSSNIELDLRCLANGGVIAAYSAHDAAERVPVPMVPAMVVNGAVRFVYVYTMPDSAKKAAIADINDCLRAGSYNPRIAMILPLSRTVDGHVAVEKGAIGKTLIRVVDE